MGLRKRAFVFPCILALLFACGFPVQPGPATLPPGTPTASPSRTPTQTAPPPATPSDTPDGSFSGSCAWTWANQELPELSDELRQEFDEASLEGVEIRASAYGENCLDAETNKVVRFTAMQTDFYLSVPVQDPEDHQAAGDWIAKVINILRPYTPGRVPGPNPGYVAIRFISSGGEENLWFSRSEAEKLIDGGTNGDDLYDAFR